MLIGVNVYKDDLYVYFIRTKLSIILKIKFKCN